LATVPDVTPGEAEGRGKGVQEFLGGVMAVFYVYIVATDRNGTLYVGVTNDIARRGFEHRQGNGSVFTRRYGVKRLVWMEPHESIVEAIAREKQIKGWNRDWKLRLIERDNPQWLDLYERLNG
jgi:putative endonuclease